MNDTYAIKLTSYAYNEQNLRPQMEAHSHAELELNFLISGEADVYYQDPKTGATECIKMFPNNFVLINPNITHFINSTSQIKYFVLEFNTRGGKMDLVSYLRQSPYVNKFSEAVKLLDDFSDVLLFKDTQNMASLLNKFRRLFDYHEHDCFYYAELEIHLKQLFLAIIQCVMEVKNTSGQNIHIKRALSYLQANYDKDISVTDIANHTQLSLAHLHRIFKESVGTTLIDKLNEIRIKKASQLLLDSHLSVKAIADLIGYNSIYTFKYNFKKIFNKTPSVYRQEKLSEIVRLINSH